MIDKSHLISRDLSWIQFNYRVLDQARKTHRSLPERLKFLAITASNSDEFFMIRAGSLYNYLDYGKDRIDYSGLRAHPFKRRLFDDLEALSHEAHRVYLEELQPEFTKLDFRIVQLAELGDTEVANVENYFERTVFPMLTPMVYDSYHSFPVLNNQVLTFGVVTRNFRIKEKKKMSFIQLPKNLPRFLELSRDQELLFLPIEEVVRACLDQLFKNVKIVSSTLFRVTRNGDFTLEESDDIEDNFLDELKKKLKTRKTGRVVRLEVEEKYDTWMIKSLLKRFELENSNLMIKPAGGLIDYAGLWQIVNHPEFENEHKLSPVAVDPISVRDYSHKDIFKILKERDVLLHHPYNTMEPLLDLIERAAEDPKVLSIKLTIYRLAKNSRITEALLEAAENGKHVAVLFEVKARFDEENNMREATRLQKAGCFVIYGVGTLKTHTKLLLIVRKEGEKVTRYVHMSSGNYNESTSRLYTDIGYLTTNEKYANDVQEFFNVITGHSLPEDFDTLITAPIEMRRKLVALIQREKANAMAGKPSGIVIKINSLQDKEAIEALYEASQAGVVIRLIVRGICCLRPGRIGLSENIEVRSIVGDFLEHSRLFYFHNAGAPRVYAGSADMMVRSFDRRLESLFEILDDFLRKQTMTILVYNWRDNVNAYRMNENGTYTPLHSEKGDETFNIHERFFKLSRQEVTDVRLFEEFNLMNGKYL